MTIQRLASELIRCSCKECGQANLIRTPFAEVEQQKFEWSGCMWPYIHGGGGGGGGVIIFVLVTQILGGTGPSAPPPFLHLWYRGYNDANIADTMASKKDLVKTLPTGPFAPPLLCNCNQTLPESQIFYQLKFCILKFRNTIVEQKNIFSRISHLNC